MGEREKKPREQVRESEMKKGKRRGETRPGDKAEAPKTEYKKEWKAATRSQFPSKTSANCAAEGFHHLYFSPSLFFCGAIFQL